MFERHITPALQKASESFPAIFLTGPRQSGKTTLLKNHFKDHHYISLETPSTLDMVQEDPLSFFSDPTKKWIIDEAQNFPKLFSYLQGIIDNTPIPGRFILSGSQNFLLHNKISQSLAGRVAIFELLPPTFSELAPHLNNEQTNLWTRLFYGFYPRPLNENLDYSLWFESYIRTYLERDVRSLINIRDLNQFQRFVQICAAHHGQLLNLTEIGIACGISQTTAREWLTLLEASYIVFRLTPYYKNYKKRLVKTPRLFFYDSGLVCHLLRITSPELLEINPIRGAIFEGFILTEIIKSQLNTGIRPNLYFWRDNTGLEIDGVIDSGQIIQFIEIKSGQTFHKEYLDNIKKLMALSEEINAVYRLVYSGESQSTMNGIHIDNWRDFVNVKC